MEIAKHLRTFRQACGDDDRAARILREGKLYNYLNIRPLLVEMDIINRCNLKCIMCLYSQPSSSEPERKLISFEEFQRIGKQIFSGTYKLSFSLSTEALMHPDFLRMAEEALRYRIPKTFISTNGTLLKKETSERLVKMGFQMINISLDAATKATYERLRGGGHFETVVANIKTLNRIKTHYGSEYPQLSISMVLMRSNLQEVPDFLRLAKSMGVNMVHLLHMVPFGELNLEKESLVFDKGGYNRVLLEARRIARENRITLIDPGIFPAESSSGGRSIPGKTYLKKINRKTFESFDLHVSRDDFKRKCCPFPWHFVGVSSTQSVSPCGWWYRGEPMGTLLDQSFDDIWTGPEYQKLRGWLLKNEPPQCCMRCPAVGMGDVSHKESFSVIPPG